MIRRKRRERILQALLDYYSDIGVGHATLSVAFLFGLFTVLSLLSPAIHPTFQSNNSATVDQQFILLSIAYWVLWAVGFRELMKFYWYLKVSNKILYDLGAYSLEIAGGKTTYMEYPLKDPRASPSRSSVVFQNRL